MTDGAVGVGPAQPQRLLPGVGPADVHRHPRRERDQSSPVAEVGLDADRGRAVGEDALRIQHEPHRAAPGGPGQRGRGRDPAEPVCIARGDRQPIALGPEQPALRRIGADPGHLHVHEAQRHRALRRPDGAVQQSLPAGVRGLHAGPAQLRGQGPPLRGRQGRRLRRPVQAIPDGERSSTVQQRGRRVHVRKGEVQPVGQRAGGGRRGGPHGPEGPEKHDPVAQRSGGNHAPSVPDASTLFQERTDDSTGSYGDGGGPIRRGRPARPGVRVRPESSTGTTQPCKLGTDPHWIEWTTTACRC